MNRYALRQAASGQLLQSVGDKVSGRVLDVGCGNMPYKRLFPHLDWTGVDARPVGDVEADAHALCFEDAEFDTVVCTDSLQYMENPTQAMAEMARVLKPGGTLILTAPCCVPDDEETLWAFHTNGMAFMLEKAGFDLKKCALKTGGNQFDSEFRNFMATFKWGVALPEGFDGFISAMDTDYPYYHLVVAVK